MSFYKVKLATQLPSNTYEIMGTTLSEAQRQQSRQRYMKSVRRTAVLPERHPSREESWLSRARYANVL